MMHPPAGELPDRLDVVALLRVVGAAIQRPRESSSVLSFQCHSDRFQDATRHIKELASVVVPGSVRCVLVWQRVFHVGFRSQRGNVVCCPAGRFLALSPGSVARVRHALSIRTAASGSFQASLERHFIACSRSAPGAFFRRAVGQGIAVCSSSPSLCLRCAAAVPGAPVAARLESCRVAFRGALTPPAWTT
jgi:hypothetical protein